MLRACLEGVREEPKAMRLALLDAAAAGEPGIARICRAAGAHEQLLGECLLSGQRAMPLPGPVVRALTGGVHGVLSARLLAGPIGPVEELREHLLAWVLALRSPASAGAAPWLAEQLRDRMRALSLAAARSTGGAPARAAQDRQRRPLRLETGAEQPGEEQTTILEAALRLLARHGHRELTVPQIADAAGVTIESFFARFATCEECITAAQEMVGEQLTAIAQDPRLRADGWARTVRPVLGSLLAHLAARPLHARALVQDAYALGEHATRSNLALASRLAALLTAGAPGSAPPIVGEAAIWGLWHTVRCLLVSRRVQLLPALTDHLAFVLLAPSIGAQPALAILREDDAAAEDDDAPAEDDGR